VRLLFFNNFLGSFRNFLEKRCLEIRIKWLPPNRWIRPAEGEIARLNQRKR